jgi:glyoxylase-like metal-dependent hydrolase (beta-lactamase superfamily II)
VVKLNNREQASNELSTETVKLANGLIEVFYPGPGHTQDNIVIWLAKTQTLFGGCFVKSLGSKTLGNTDDASIEDWPQSIKKVQDKYPYIKTIVPGHGKVGGKRLLNHTEQLALSVKTHSHTPHK